MGKISRGFFFLMIGSRNEKERRERKDEIFREEREVGGWGG